MTKLKPLFYTSLLLGAVACQSASEPNVAAHDGALEDPTSPGYGSVAWEETAGATVAQLREQLPLLQGRDLQLALHWHTDALDDPERWALIDEALRLGIYVQPWLLLPQDDGYFPNATSYERWIPAARELMQLWAARGLYETSLVVDMEMAKDKLHEFQQLTAAGDVSGVLQFLRGNVDRAQYAAASDAFRAFVEDAHAQHFRVNATTLLPLLDDYADGDDDLRQAFDCPIDSADWDELSFQIQRTIYDQQYPVTSHMVYDYAKRAREAVGAIAGVGVGLTQEGISPDPSIVYNSGDDLRADVEAARAAGIEPARIGVYSFLGMYTREPTAQWFQRAEPKKPLPDLGTGLLHASIQLTDALLP